MERKLRDGYVADSIKTHGGISLPIVWSTWHGRAQCWFRHEAPDECFEPEETLPDKAKRRVTEIRELQGGGATVYVQVTDAPLTPEGDSTKDVELAGQRGRVALEGDGCECVRVQFHPCGATPTVWANNLKILDHIPPEFQEEELRVKGERVVAEIQAQLDKGEYPHVRMAEVPVDFQGRPCGSDVAGLVGRITATASSCSVRIQFPGSDGLRWPHNLTIVSPKEMLVLANRGKA